MFSNVEVFKIWAPDNALWTAWAKPVSFMNLEQIAFEDLMVPQADWATQSDPTAAIIVDLPGKDSVLEGFALARRGYRPVPLYNGVCYSSVSTRMAVPMREIGAALFDCARELSTLRLPHDAPPVFLLDSNRMETRALPGDYDNRWSVFAQDMPSASYLVSKGINKVIVRSDKIRDDLEHVLYRYQSLGLMIYKQDGEDLREITVSKPSKFKSMLYRFSVIMGLKRNPAGGFGGMVPEPGSGG